MSTPLVSKTTEISIDVKNDKGTVIETRKGNFSCANIDAIFGKRKGETQSKKNPDEIAKVKAYIIGKHDKDAKSHDLLSDDEFVLWLALRRLNLDEEQSFRQNLASVTKADPNRAMSTVEQLALQGKIDINALKALLAKMEPVSVPETETETETETK